LKLVWDEDLVIIRSHINTIRAIFKALERDVPQDRTTNFQCKMLSSLLSASFLFSAFVSSATAQTNTSSFSSFNCSEFLIPVSISAQTTKFNLTNPKDQFELSGLVTRMTYLNSTLVEEVTIGPSTVNATYNIWSQLCVPDGFDEENGILEFTIHG